MSVHPLFDYRNQSLPVGQWEVMGQVVVVVGSEDPVGAFCHIDLGVEVALYDQMVAVHCDSSPRNQSKRKKHVRFLHMQ